MKKTILTALFLGALTLGINAQELPAPSPYAELHQRVGLTDFNIEYSRPGVKDREIFGGLLEYGKIWRTGANSSTKIEFSTTVTFADKEVEAGKYSVFTIPGDEMWSFILNSDLNASENSYDESKNVLKLEVKPTETAQRESMLIYFDHLRDESAHLVIEWATTKVAIPLMVNADEQAVENIKSKIQEIEGNFRVYNSAARYYLDHDKDLQQALKWSKKSVEIESRFWNVYTLSLIHNKIGNKKEAIATAKKSLEMATKENYAPYIKMNEENIAAWSK